MEQLVETSQKKAWARPEIIFISQGNIEGKTRTFGHEKTFVRSSDVGGNHYVTFQGPAHSITVPASVSKMDFIS